MHKFNFAFRSGGAWERGYCDTVHWSLQVSHGVLDNTFYHSIPSHVKTLHDTLDKYEVTNPYGLFRRYLFVLTSMRLLVSNPGDLGPGIWVQGSGSGDLGLGIWVRGSGFGDLGPESGFNCVCMYCISLIRRLGYYFFRFLLFVRVLFEGGVYFFGKPADISEAG